MGHGKRSVMAYLILTYDVATVLDSTSVADPDPGSGAFLTLDPDP